MPQISIVIPFKNEAQYLSQCLDSIQVQDFQNWEVVAVDDQSEDSSAHIVQDYAKRDERIRCLKNEGRGVIQALQTAYKKCSGKFISRMDADDIFAKNRLSSMYKALDKKGRGHISVGQVKYFSDNELGEGYRKYEQWLNEMTAQGSNFDQIYKECVIPSPAWMMYTADFDACGSFDSNLMPEDYDLAFRLYQNSMKVIPFEQLALHWRDHPLRSSRNSSHYADNSFIDLKLHYFFKIDYDNQKSLCLWGAGKKAKRIAQYLVNQSIPFNWFTNNDKKIGHSIFGVELESSENIISLNSIQMIIGIAQKGASIEIEKLLAKSELKAEDIFWFC